MLQLHVQTLRLMHSSSSASRRPRNITDGHWADMLTQKYEQTGKHSIKHWSASLFKPSDLIWESSSSLSVQRNYLIYLPVTPESNRRWAENTSVVKRLGEDMGACWASVFTASGRRSSPHFMTEHRAMEALLRWTVAEVIMLNQSHLCRARVRRDQRKVHSYYRKMVISDFCCFQIKAYLSLLASVRLPSESCPVHSLQSHIILRLKAWTDNK